MPTETDFLPNLFILGAAKCGTTTIYAYLEKMPDVCMSVPKEPLFFEAEYDEGLDYYQQKYFGHWQGEAVIGEARQVNLYLPWVPDRIAATNPAAKLIALLRNPVERAFSHWVHQINAGEEPLSFSEAIAEDWKRIDSGKRFTTAEEQAGYAKLLGMNEHVHDSERWYRTYIDRGYYAEQIERYRERFPAEQLKIILFEDLTRSPKKTVNEVVEFLELDPERNRFEQDLWKNQANVPGWSRWLYEQLRMYHFVPEFSRRWVWRFLRRLRKSRTDRDTWTWLREHFQEPNERLADLIGRDLSHWNRI